MATKPFLIIFKFKKEEAQMELTIEKIEKEIILVSIEGEIVGEARFELLRALLGQTDKGAKGIIIDIDQVPMMDSVFLGILATIKEILLKKEGDLLLLNARRNVRYLLLITKLDLMFNKFDDSSEAVDFLKEVLAKSKGKD
ncbi:STAS domain-containing protein [Candidatus Gribaldobacteria bacterium]|nr:STAS domain-containing protein [Candidatus Gribaldobacteria bacterium]